MNIHILKLPIGVLLVTGTALAIIFAFTLPVQLHAALLILVFGLIFVFLGAVNVILLMIVRWLGKKEWKDLSLRRIAIGVALVPTFLLILQSIGQLTVQDVLLTLAFGGIFYFYYQRFFVNRDAVPN